jgi:hypothetical protein
MAFPKESYAIRTENTSDGITAISDLSTISDGTDVALYRLVRSGPLTRKVNIGTVQRKPRCDKGKANKKAAEPK